MKFFVPAAKDDTQAEHVRDATVKFARETLGWEISDRKIRRLAYEHNGADWIAEVGELCPVTGETVILILESNAYLVCTENRGVVRGEPMLVGTTETYSVEDFNDPS